jgi:3-phenylpropionate/trans-cinnamate dioxygenase ferredoxin reductase subunit
VLGTSFVGLKVAEILTKRHIRVILLDVADQVLPRGAHPISAAIIRTNFEGHGVDVRLGCTMDGMEGAGEGVTCHFTDDVIKEVDFVVVCTRGTAEPCVRGPFAGEDRSGGTGG